MSAFDYKAHSIGFWIRGTRWARSQLRRFLYGYRRGEVPIQIHNDPDPSVRIVHHTLQPTLQKRAVVAVDSGVAFVDSVPPHPDLSDPATVQLGVKKRLATRLPQPRRATIRAAKGFVRKFVRQRVARITDEDIPAVEEWFLHTSYTEKEKQEIREAPDVDWDAPDSPETRKLVSEFASFIKAEFYLGWKAPRTIQGLSPSMKKFLGPIIHACEQVLFALDPFAKFVSVTRRPRWLRDKFANIGSAKVAASDFESFEQSWKKAQMETFEIPLVEHMLSRTSCFQKFMRIFRMMELGAARLVFKWLTVIVGAVRKSGTTNTSFSNGGGNWLIHEFLGWWLKLGELIGAFEGDDGLFCYSSGRFPRPEDYAELGFVVKLEVHDCPERASFCGIVYHPDDCVNIVDPIKTLNRIGWLAHQYARARNAKIMSLLRSKAMSLCVQTVNCPILAECAQWLLRCTKSYDARWVIQARSTDWWQRQVLSQTRGFNFNLVPTPPPATRVLMEEVFNVPVSTQLRYEEWFKSSTKLEPMPYLFDERDPAHSFNAEFFCRENDIPALDNYPVFPDLNGELERWSPAATA